MDDTAYIPVKPGSDRAFAILFALIFLAIALYPWAVSTGGVRLWSLAIAGVLGITGLVIPKIFHYPNRYWIKLGMVVGRAMSPIILGLVFYVVVTPIAFLARLFGSDPLRMKQSVKEGETYWLERLPEENASDTMARQY
ncbi:SxtJ family membrane protein [Pontixanthobacter aestiaquae]|uniref:SxtJ n=1 Tax=Pontixanthobacter aestiaquae TaxID=1509367 RepID=A0A844Z414_9SPHN|nr:SxtJ family membrane protein [Pontixanthobacter aestiaquae]MDN3647006.1 SxtJ family membrane protein [Pontixanthobacter aestiaquae]MXO82016.1 hypothetical protein [Pontixanthobacter aestiaquae]